MPKPYFYNKKDKIDEILRVNHAGEFGAQQIYKGQIKYTKNIEEKKIIQDMLTQELEHLEYFDNAIKNHNTRPTALIPFWRIFGYGMGVVSAKLGTKTAMLVTEAVEEVIVEHYQEQIDFLEGKDIDSHLLKKIKKFKEDEAGHIHIAVENNSKSAPLNKITSSIVKNICKSAIFLSKKL